MNRIKSRLAWALMLLVAACALGIGATRASGPSTQAERIDAITKRLACPTCDGESVYVSRASAAESIRNQVARDVAAGRLGDDQIIAVIADRFKAQVLLVPRATGFDSLVWIVPVVVLVVSIAALAGAFRRWRDEQPADPTAADEELVDRLLRAEPGTGRDDPS
ncbi:MAG: cytochrome c-type biogenesis protein CcmH [Actinomycetota bacterium]